MKAKISIITKREIILPSVPNFIRTEHGEAIDISELSSEQLKEIGDAWLAELKTKAALRRGGAIQALNTKIGEARLFPRENE